MLNSSSVIVDHNNEETVKEVLDRGFWAAFTIYPFTKMGNERMVEIVRQYGTERIMVNSAADWGISDPLKVPKTIAVMREQGIGEDTIQQIVWNNPVAFFAQSGRLDLGEVEQRLAIDRGQQFESNSVLRGERPAR